MTHNATGVADAQSAAVYLAEEIRRRRKAADLSHAQLAAKIGYTRQYVSLAERPGKGLPSLGLIRAIDQALHTDGALLTLREKADAAQQARRHSRTSVLVADVVRARAAGAPGLAPTSDGSQTEVAVAAPPGRFFAGTSISALAYPASDDGRILTAVPTDFANDLFLRRARRGLVVGVTDDERGVGMFGWTLGRLDVAWQARLTRCGC